MTLEDYKTLLKENHNLILTGAPGTGKTYLAKEIAKEMIKDGKINSYNKQQSEKGIFTGIVQASDVKEKYKQYLIEKDNNTKKNKPGTTNGWYPNCFIEMGKDLKKIDNKYNNLKDDFFEYNSNDYKNIFKEISGLSDDKIQNIINGKKKNNTEEFRELDREYRKAINVKENRPNPNNTGGIPRLGTLMRSLLKFHFSMQDEQTFNESEQIAFVQFHPSYDYTDFVEGLRPIQPDKNGNIGFKLEDGILKKFCKKALENFLNSKKSQETLSKEISIKNIIDGFLDYAIEESKSFKTIAKSSEFVVSNADENRIYIEIKAEQQYNKIYFSKKYLIRALEDEKTFDTLANFRKEYGLYRDQSNSYLFAIYKEIKDLLKYPNKENKNELKENNEEKKYIFIIDEINRGEISKIFGELFFSIDPGYRGIDGKVKTQYQNMLEEGDHFYDDFYVPENVYIIGTMNDIDRSVESFDFAMRRRFVWEEITAEQSAENMELSSETRKRMENLNTAISKIDGLNSSYHIGGAYFLKKDEDEEVIEPDYDELWKLRLKPLLSEYLRGMPNFKDSLDGLEKAYKNPQGIKANQQQNEVNEQP